MAKFTATPDHSAWNSCASCKTDASRANRTQRVHFLTYMYQQFLYAAHPFKVMLLSVVDVSMNFTNRFTSFLQGGMRPKGLLDCAFLRWNQEGLDCSGYADLPTCVKEIYDTCLVTNPSLQHYLTFSERANANSALPILFDNTVASMIGTHQRRKPNKRMRVDVAAAVLAVHPTTSFQIQCLHTTASYAYAKSLDHEEQFILHYNTRSSSGYNTLGKSGTKDAKFYLLKYRRIIE